MISRSSSIGLRRNDRYLSREEFESACESGRAADGLVLTFDDGLIDHYRYVLPLLVERGLFGIFYVCTAPLRTAETARRASDSSSAR